MEEKAGTGIAAHLICVPEFVNLPIDQMAFLFFHFQVSQILQFAGIPGSVTPILFPV